MHLPSPHRPTILALLLSAVVSSQSISPSNSTTDLYPAATSPRFLINGSQISDIPSVRIAPLGKYAEMTHSAFTEVSVTGKLVYVTASNANKPQSESTAQFSLLSCDPQAYADGNLDAADVFKILVNAVNSAIIILYSTTSDHCSATGLDNLPPIGGVLTITDRMMSQTLATLAQKGQLNTSSPGDATILPDLNAYTNSSGDNSFSGGFGQSPTTAVAMIVLYSITGIITALFVIIIVTGAVRAHRHPERYGPRNIVGRGRQSRARGIARAMLDTLPIVKFGDRENDGAVIPKKPNSSHGTDIEMNANHTDEGRNVQGTNDGADSDQPRSTTHATAATHTTTHSETAATTNTESSPNAQPTNPESARTSTPTPPGTAPDLPDDNGLACSICTEDFHLHEDVRVLPCKHKFHPECVDPWLLNVSGTCPLCRIDLRPQQEAEEEEEAEGGEREGRDGTNGERVLVVPDARDRERPATRMAAENTSHPTLLTERQRSSVFTPAQAYGGTLDDAIGFPSLRSGRGDTMERLRRAALGNSVEERISALRRYRQERRQGRMPGNGNGNESGNSGAAEGLSGEGENEANRRGLARRLRQRFTIRTERRE